MTQSANKSILRYLLPSLREVFFISLFVGVVGLGPRLLNIDGDLGRHLTIGEYILENRTIPTQDIFSYTLAGEPLTPHEWLAEVIFAIAFRLMGLNGVVLLCGAVLAVTFSLCYRQCYLQGGVLLIALGWSILAAAAASLHWLARPHIFTLLFVVLWVTELENIRTRRVQRWWLLPVFMLVWANLHGAFIAGFAVWGVYFIGYLGDGWLSSRKKQQELDPHSKIRTGRVLVKAGLLSFIASLCNPAGWHLWSTSLGFIQNHYLVSHTAEYLPPNFQDISTLPFLGMVVFSIFLLGILANLDHSQVTAHTDSIYPVNSFSVTPVLLLSVWTMMSLYSVRNVPIYTLVAAPILSKISFDLVNASDIGEGVLTRFMQLNKRLSVVEDSLRGFLWPAISVLLVILAFIGGIHLDYGGQGNHFDPAVFPVAALNWIQDHPVPDHVFNSFNWGGYILFREWPSKTVFIDGQTDFYGEAFTRQYEKVITLAEGWRKVLDQYQVNWILMPTDSQLVKALAEDNDWSLVYQDQTAAILLRDR